MRISLGRLSVPETPCHASCDECNDYRDEVNFKRFIEDQFSVDITTALDAYIHRNWKMFVERIDLLQRIDDLFSTQTIGLIEVKNLKPSDSQKIFNLINSQGSPLKAVEILSARPKWNLKIESPCAEVKQLVQELYRTQMDIIPGEAKAWTIPQRTYEGRVKVGTPTEDSDAATKTYVDDAITK